MHETTIPPFSSCSDADQFDDLGSVSGDERGAGLVEYALLVALIVLVCVAAVTLLGNVTSSQISSVVPPLQ